MPKIIIITGYQDRQVSDLAYVLGQRHKVPAFQKYYFKEREPDFAHPEKMVEFARLCAKIAHTETILVATFSDYFVKEINNLIMAAHAGATAKRCGYTPDIFLDAASVEAYISEQDGSTTKVEIDPQYGIEKSPFDDEIRRIDDAANMLAAAVELNEKT